MRLVIAHNFYASAQPSGENRTVAEITEGLRSRGVDVLEYFKESDSINTLGRRARISLVNNPLWTSPNSDFDRFIQSVKPDVIQVHNAYPQIPLGSLFRQRTRGVPVNHVIHNFRHTCIAGSHYRDGSDCFDCTASRFGNASGLIHRCYRSSAAQSGIMTLSNTVHYERWRNLDYTAISEFVRQYLLRSGFPADRVVTIANPVGTVIDPIDQPTGRDILFASRLEPEKGVKLLLDAWSQRDKGGSPNSSLHVAGSGTLTDLVKTRASADPSITFHGPLQPAELQLVSRTCAITAVPSVWDEPFGRTVAEAYRSRRAVITSNRGALPELVEHGTTGWVADTTLESWVTAVNTALSSVNPAMQTAAFSRWKERYSADTVARQYHEHLEQLIAGR